MNCACRSSPSAVHSTNATWTTVAGLTQRIVAMSASVMPSPQRLLPGLLGRLTNGHRKKFEFVEKQPEPVIEIPTGLQEFLKDTALSSEASKEDLEFLKNLRFSGRQPTPLYYYRELQNLRDPLHFGPEPAAERRPAQGT